MTDTAQAEPSPSWPPAGRAPGMGLSAIELAAQRGIGPLSALGTRAWHGEAKPCVSCGQLVRRTASVCDQCGQDLSPQMLVRMQAHCGPWYVLEHVRPFPGVTLDRLVRQAMRGVLTATTIVRGPTTYHQWRFAGETPGLSKYVGVCWRCQASVSVDDESCPICRANLAGETDALIEQALPAAAQGAIAAPPRVVQPRRVEQGELGELSQAVSAGAGSKAARADSRSTTVLGVRVYWLVVGLVAVFIAVLCVMVAWRTRRTEHPEPESRPVAEWLDTRAESASIAARTATAGGRGVRTA